VSERKSHCRAHTEGQEVTYPAWTERSLMVDKGKHGGGGPGAKKRRWGTHLPQSRKWGKKRLGNRGGNRGRRGQQQKKKEKERWHPSCEKRGSAAKQRETGTTESSEKGQLKKRGKKEQILWKKNKGPMSKVREGAKKRT